ncbi:MAG: pyridoxamine 5'-phosphate oxidase family protein [Marinoscillum sp.]
MKITEELMPCLQGAIPSQIVTVNEDNIPNTTIISQVFPADDEHVAISNQFFSKTFQNLQNNKKACVQVFDPSDLSFWTLDLEMVRIEDEGDLFDEMSMQLEAIASMSGMEDVFVLKSAYILKVLNFHHVTEAMDL